MPRASRGLTALIVLLLTLSRAQADDPTVIIAEGDRLPRVKVGDLLRLTASGSAGRTNITISVQGAAKLVSTTKVRKAVNGKILLGNDTKEFLIQATAKGAAILTVTNSDVVDHTAKKQEYELDVD